MGRPRKIIKEPETMAIDEAPEPKSAGPVPRVEVMNNQQGRAILLTMDACDGNFRGRVNCTTGRGYYCSDWISGGGTAVMPVDSGKDYTVAYQIANQGKRGEWIIIGDYSVPPMVGLTKGPAV